MLKIAVIYHHALVSHKDSRNFPIKPN